MPQAQLKDGSIMVCGMAVKDADFKVVGEKNSRVCSIGLAIGKRKDTTTIFANVKAWHDLASVLATAQKGDSVFVWGRMTEPREYNGKIYQDLQADWLSIASVHQLMQETARSPMPHADDKFTDLDVDESQLPF